MRGVALVAVLVLALAGCSNPNGNGQQADGTSRSSTPSSSEPGEPGRPTTQCQSAQGNATHQFFPVGHYGAATGSYSGSAFLINTSAPDGVTNWTLTATWSSPDPLFTSVHLSLRTYPGSEPIATLDLHSGEESHFTTDAPGRSFEVGASPGTKDYPLSVSSGETVEYTWTETFGC